MILRSSNLRRCLAAVDVNLDRPIEISGKRVTDISLMPTGLLDRLSDRDLADLYAYLRSLGTRSAPRRRQ